MWHTEVQHAVKFNGNESLLTKAIKFVDEKVIIESRVEPGWKHVLLGKARQNCDSCTVKNTMYKNNYVAGIVIWLSMLLFAIV